MNSSNSKYKEIHHWLVIFTLVAFNFSCKKSIAQAHTPEIQKVEKSFFEAFNHGAIHEFRSLFDEDLKKRNSYEKLNTSFDQITSQIGSIRSLELDNAEGNLFVYRSIHEKMVTLKVVFGLNNRGNLSQMSITSDYVYKDAPLLERNKSDLILPFRNEWYVFWGGKKTSSNYHNAYPSMKGAFDFWVMGTNGKSHRKGATKNEDFYAFGKEIIAPIDAKVIYAFDDIPDNKWPAMNSNAGTGNVVVLETKYKEYIVLGHLKQNSIVVKEGQQVKQGEPLGLCGNSGKSTEPHLHFQIQNIPDFGSAKGAWVHFKRIKVHGVIKEDYIPIKGDKISN